MLTVLVLDLGAVDEADDAVEGSEAGGPVPVGDPHVFFTCQGVYRVL